MAGKTVKLTITSAVVVAGEIATPNTVVTLDEREAKNLLAREKAVLFESDDADEKPLSESTVKELREIADEYEIEGWAKMSKPDLIKAIEAAESE